MSKRISLTQYLVEQQREHGHIPAQLRLLIEVVARACKRIAISVNKGALGEVLGSAGSENVQGEVQKKLDIISNEVLIEANEWGDNVCALRAVTSTDGMTADIYPFDAAFLSRVATRIINEVKGINRVVYDYTSKPPGTIEWE